MAKAKLKREKREIDKLLRAGRHLEWLAAVRDMPVTAEHKRDLDKVWSEVRRHSLRTREGFEEYCRLRPELEKIPPHPENLFLETLVNLLQGESGAAEAMLALPKLTGAAQVVQQHLVTLLHQERDWDEVARLLHQMGREPDKISRKHLLSLAACFSDTPLAQVFERLGQSLMTFRKLNHKTHLHKPLGYALLNDLADADLGAWQATMGFPPSLRRLLLLPLVEQVRLHLGQALPKPRFQQVWELIDTARKVFFEVAGPHLSDELRAQLSIRSNEDCSDGACHRLQQRFSAAPLEERLTLLRDFRLVVQREAHNAIDDYAASFFSSIRGVTPVMERLLLHCHREVLLEFGRRLMSLAPRDRRSLLAFYDQLLADDLSLLLLPDGDLATLAQLVHLALESGCYGSRLLLMAPVVAGVSRNRALALLAVKTIANAALPTKAHLQWFAEGVLALALQMPATLRPIFTRIGGDEELAGYLGQAVWQAYSDAMLDNAFEDEFGSSLPGEERGEEYAVYSHEVRRGLLELAADVPQLERLHRFLQAFPTGRVDVVSLREWCEVAWSADVQCLEWVNVALPLLHQAQAQASLLQTVKSLNLGKAQLTHLQASIRQLAEVTDFLRSRIEDFQVLPVSVLTPLVMEVFACLERQQGFDSLVVRTYNALCTRIKAGEKNCAFLRDEVERYMRKKAGHRR